MNWLGAIVCWWEGRHLRGRKVGEPYMNASGPVQDFRCPRCSRETTRRVTEKRKA